MSTAIEREVWVNDDCPIVSIVGPDEKSDRRWRYQAKEWISAAKLGLPSKTSDLRCRVGRIESSRLGSWRSEGRVNTASDLLEATDRALRCWTDSGMHSRQLLWESFCSEPRGDDAVVYGELAGRFVAHHIAVAKESGLATRKRFHDLLDVWRKDVAILSSLDGIVMHEAYQQIIGMGEKVLPLILDEFTREIDHWPWALEAITGENPVPEKMRGRLRMARDCWVGWGKARGLL